MGLVCPVLSLGDNLIRSLSDLFSIALFFRVCLVLVGMAVLVTQLWSYLGFPGLVDPDLYASEAGSSRTLHFLVKFLSPLRLCTSVFLDKALMVLSTPSFYRPC